MNLQKVEFCRISAFEKFRIHVKSDFTMTFVLFGISIIKKTTYVVKGWRECVRIELTKEAINPSYRF